MKDTQSSNKISKHLRFFFCCVLKKENKPHKNAQTAKQPLPKNSNKNKHNTRNINSSVATQKLFKDEKYSNTVKQHSRNQDPNSHTELENNNQLRAYNQQIFTKNNLVSCEYENISENEAYSKEYQKACINLNATFMSPKNQVEHVSFQGQIIKNSNREKSDIDRNNVLKNAYNKLNKLNELKQKNNSHFQYSENKPENKNESSCSEKRTKEENYIVSPSSNERNYLRSQYTANIQKGKNDVGSQHSLTKLKEKRACDYQYSENKLPNNNDNPPSKSKHKCDNNASPDPVNKLHKQSDIVLPYSLRSSKETNHNASQNSESKLQNQNNYPRSHPESKSRSKASPYSVKRSDGKSEIVSSYSGNRSILYNGHESPFSVNNSNREINIESPYSPYISEYKLSNSKHKSNNYPSQYSENQLGNKIKHHIQCSSNKSEESHDQDAQRSENEVETTNSEDSQYSENKSEKKNNDHYPSQNSEKELENKIDHKPQYTKTNSKMKNNQSSLYKENKPENKNQDHYPIQNSENKPENKIDHQIQYSSNKSEESHDRDTQQSENELENKIDHKPQYTKTNSKIKNNQSSLYKEKESENKNHYNYPIQNSENKSEINPENKIDHQIQYLLNKSEENHDRDTQHSENESENKNNYPASNSVYNNKNKDQDETESINDESTLSSSYDVGVIRGFDNPKGYCFLNSVVQILRSCKDFNKAIIKYHESSKIVESKEEINKIVFVNAFCKMIFDLMKGNDIQVQLNEIQNYFKDSSSGDDVNKCFMNILSIINDVSKETNKSNKNNPTSEADRKFHACRNANYGFVFECFYGQMSHKIICEGCEESHSSYQLFKCLTLPVPKSKESVPLSRCVEIFFEKSEIDITDFMNCKCNPEKKKYLKYEITHSPKYLFVYLERGSFFHDQPKKETFIKCDETISIETSTGPITYRLISLIDHVGTNENGHYFCKCSYEKNEWWLLNDSNVRKIEHCATENLISKNTIVFMFKK